MKISDTMGGLLISRERKKSWCELKVELDFQSIISIGIFILFL